MSNLGETERILEIPAEEPAWPAITQPEPEREAVPETERETVPVGVPR